MNRLSAAGLKSVATSARRKRAEDKRAEEKRAEQKRAEAKGAAEKLAQLKQHGGRDPHHAQPHDQAQCLLAPLHYEPNYAYPLLVWLHDDGGSERELKRVMPLVSLRNYVSLAVRGTGAASDGFGWADSRDEVALAETQIIAAVATASQRFHVHPGRVFLAGHGAGGTLALRLALRSPRKYAGGASIGGAFPSGDSPLVQLAAARESRLLIMHCRDSERYTVERVCDELALFHAAGMSVTLRQYPCGDELTTQMLRDLDVWLMEQVTGVSTPESAEPTALPSEWN